MGRSIVKAVDLGREYKSKTETVSALKDVNLDVETGEYLSILGKSGSGKTTLLNLIGGLDTPTKGTVLVEDEDLFSLNSVQRARLRCLKIGYIFQTFNLIPFLPASDNVALPMVFAGIKASERKKRALELLELVGLGERAQHRPSQLSGGEQQRVAIARALANDPAIILADEPTGNLDLKTGLGIVQLLYRLRTERRATVICATHDLKMIEVSDRIAWLLGGRLERMERQQSVTLRAEELEKAD